MSWRIVAQRVADGIVLSTGNLYFTAHDNAGASVFRTAQSAKPGQEIELCHESDCRFGDIVWAKVDDVFYGYFFALARGMTTIRRIPLAAQPGQVAQIIGPPTADIDIVSGHGNLVTDGSFLYWQSDTAINKMSVRGGAVTVLDRTPLTRPATGLHLVGPNLIYAVGRVVYYVPVDGSAVSPPASRVVFTVATGVVACAPLVGSLFAADRNGAIIWHADSGSGQVKQNPGAAFITSMAYDGAHAALAWTQMAGAWQLHLEAGASHSRRGRTLALPCSTLPVTCTGSTTTGSSLPARFKNLVAAVAAGSARWCATSAPGGDANHPLRGALPRFRRTSGRNLSLRLIIARIPLHHPRRDPARRHLCRAGSGADGGRCSPRSAARRRGRSRHILNARIVGPRRGPSARPAQC